MGAANEHNTQLALGSSNRIEKGISRSAGHRRPQSHALHASVHTQMCVCMCVCVSLTCIFDIRFLASSSQGSSHKFKRVCLRAWVGGRCEGGGGGGGGCGGGCERSRGRMHNSYEALHCLAEYRYENCDFCRATYGIQLCYWCL